MKYPRAHGLPWRFLAQDSNDRVSHRSEDCASVVPFDELVVGGWLHIERMGDHDWSIIIGDVMLNAHVTKAGVRVLLVEGEVEQ